METVRVFISAPAATFENACKNLARSTSVTAVNGTSEMHSFAHSTVFIPYVRVRASSAYVTCETRRQEVSEATCPNESKTKGWSY